MTEAWAWAWSVGGVPAARSVPRAELDLRNAAVSSAQPSRKIGHNLPNGKSELRAAKLKQKRAARATAGDVAFDASVLRDALLEAHTNFGIKARYETVALSRYARDSAAKVGALLGFKSSEVGSGGRAEKRRLVFIRKEVEVVESEGLGNQNNDDDGSSETEAEAEEEEEEEEKNSLLSSTSIAAVDAMCAHLIAVTSGEGVTKVVVALRSLRKRRAEKRAALRSAAGGGGRAQKVEWLREGGGGGEKESGSSDNSISDDDDDKCSSDDESDVTDTPETTSRFVAFVPAVDANSDTTTTAAAAAAAVITSSDVIENDKNSSNSSSFEVDDDDMADLGTTLARTSLVPATPSDSTTTPLSADWEAHTRGLGSKLLAKWGFNGGSLGVSRGKVGTTAIIQPALLDQIPKKGRAGLGA